MKTIKECATGSQIIEKSKFIAYLLPVSSKEEIEHYLTQYHTQYFDATHICYAYILSEDGVYQYKAFDDGEPSSTAGAPILNVLKTNELCNVLCVVIRYFGGIKLGAGGLVRAYGKTALLALKEAKLGKICLCDQYQLTFAYPFVRPLDLFLDKVNAKVIQKDFSLQVTYQVIFLQEEDIVQLKQAFANQIVIQWMKKIQQII